MRRPDDSPRQTGEGSNPVSKLRHDLLTPLNTLLGGLDLLLKTALTDQQRKYAEMCKRSAEALLKMARELHERFPQPPAAAPASAKPPDPNPETLRSLAADGVGFLGKPITRAQLLEAIAGAAGDGRKKPALRILLAEDSSDSRTLCAQYLKETAHNLETVGDGRTAVDRFCAGQYDLVLMDVDMPVLNGVAAVREIRAWERNNSRPPTPIIALTGYELTPSIPAQAIDSGEGEIVVEPEEEIAHLIPEFLASRRKDVRTILEALDAGEFDRIRTLGHMLKGAGGAYGFAGLSQLGRQLEQAATQKDADDIRRAATLLSSYLDRVRTAKEHSQPKGAEQ